MKKITTTVALLLILSFMLVSLPEIGMVKAESTLDSSFVLSPVEYTNVTSHTGDIVLDGNDVMLIKDARFELNGSLLMSGNSTLILDNSELYPVFGRWQESYELRDNAKMIVKRGSYITSGIFDFRLYDNTLLNVTNSEVSKFVEGMHAGIRVQSFGSHFRVLSVMAGGFLQMVNSSGSIVECDGDAQIVNSTIESLTVARNARIVDSYVESLAVRGGSSQAPSSLTCYLINSTYGGLDKDAFDKGAIYVGWHLTIIVESEGQPVEGANVEIYYVHNGSLAEQQVTQSDGKAQFDLMEWRITELGSQYVGDYRINVSYDTTQTEETITLTSSQELTIPEFPPWIILPLLIILMLLAIVFKKKVFRPIHD